MKLNEMKQLSIEELKIRLKDTVERDGQLENFNWRCINWTIQSRVRLLRKDISDA